MAGRRLAHLSSVERRRHDSRERLPDRGTAVYVFTVFTDWLSAGHFVCLALLTLVVVLMSEVCQRKGAVDFIAEDGLFVCLIASEKCLGMWLLL